MRLIKDGHEVDLMRRAADISAGAHRRAMRAAAAGRHEYEIEAELLHEFRRRGSQYPAYTSIVASGANACVLHYVDNNRLMRDGELLLIDAGCELDGYAADITRSFPVNGRFSGPQADVYDLVLDAQSAAIAAVRPGASFMAPHDAAREGAGPGHDRHEAAARQSSTASSSRKATSAFTCTAPATGWAATCTMPANTSAATRRTTTGGRSPPAWC